MSVFVFFFNDTATTEIYTLSLHDALPILAHVAGQARAARRASRPGRGFGRGRAGVKRRRANNEAERFVRTRGQGCRSEEHTSELQSRQYLVCRLLLEKKKIKYAKSAWFI